MQYNTNFPCKYAIGQFMVFPAGFYNEKKVGDGSVDFFDKDNFVWFRPGVSEEMKQRVINDLKEYYAKEREKGYY